MYVSVDEDLRKRLIEKKQGIAGGRIGYGYSNSTDYSMVVGLVMGLLIGLFLAAPELLDTLGFRLGSLYDNFWPTFIALIVITVGLSKAVDASVKYFAMNKFLNSPDLSVQMGTVMLRSLKGKPAFAVLEDDHRSPVPHYLNIIYMNLKKPRILNEGTRVYIFKTSNSIAIIPVTDITGAPESAGYTYNEQPFDPDAMACIYHPAVFDVDSTERPLTDETRSSEFRRIGRRTLSGRLFKSLKPAGWTLGICIFIYAIVCKDLPGKRIFWIFLIFALTIVVVAVAFGIHTFLLSRKIYTSDYVRTSFVEFPKSMSWTGSTVLSVADYRGGNLERFSYDVRSASRKFHFFDTVEIFYKKEIDGVKTLC